MGSSGEVQEMLQRVHVQEQKTPPWVETAKSTSLVCEIIAQAKEQKEEV